LREVHSGGDGLKLYPRRAEPARNQRRFAQIIAKGMIRDTDKQWGRRHVLII
jgi:hypothetical protein